MKVELAPKLNCFVKGSKIYQEQSPVRGFQSSSDPVLNFGIGKNNSIDSILVIWPDDNFQKLINVKPNQTLTIKLTDAKEKWVYDTIVNAKQSLLLQTTLPGVQHHENTFSDFTCTGFIAKLSFTPGAMY